MAIDLSPTMRDYLVGIYRLSEHIDTDDAFVGTSSLADMLDVSPPAVNRMVIRLKDQGLLEHTPYQGIRLTVNGKCEALKQLRNHRIAEAFLVNVMQFGWHEVHDEADRLCQGMTDTISARMFEMAGHPAFCPHGEPIPTVEGVLSEPADILLIDAQTETQYEITRVRTRESDRLEYLAALGLVPSKRLSIIHQAPFNGPIQLKIGSEYRIIGHNLAELIKVLATA
ncbi:MAG: metal-dependent transcriptional regulator [Anaerolineae bacterium]